MQLEKKYMLFKNLSKYSQELEHPRQLWGVRLYNPGIPSLNKNGVSPTGLACHCPVTLALQG